MTIIIIVLIAFLLRKPLFTLLFSSAHALGMEESDLESGKKMSDSLFKD